MKVWLPSARPVSCAGELHEVARTAALRGDERAALGAARAMDAVELAKARAAGNVTPQLASYELLRALSGALR